MGSAPRTPVPHVCCDMVKWDKRAGDQGFPVIAPELFFFIPKSDLEMCENRNQGGVGKVEVSFSPQSAPPASLAHLSVCPHEEGVQGDVELGSEPWH